MDTEEKKSELKVKLTEFIAKFGSHLERLERIDGMLSAIEARAVLPGKNFHFENNAYWLTRIEGNRAWYEGPYCSRCYDIDDRLVSMHDGGGAPTGSECPHCKVRALTPQPPGPIAFA